MSGRDDCIKIRRVETRDELESVLPLINEANEWFVKCENDARSPEAYKTPIAYSFDDFREHLPFYAFDKSKLEIVGCVSLRRWYTDENIVILDDLYVKPEYRHYGIGRMLARHAIDFAHADGRHIELGIIDRNEPAKKFWKKLLPNKTKLFTYYYIG